MKVAFKTAISLILLMPIVSMATTNIAILVDGKSQFYDEIIALYEKEIIDLTSGEFDIKFATHVPHNGGWTYQTIQSKYSALQADANIDVVLTLGIVSSLVAAYDSSPQKPTFAPYVIDANFPGLPREGLASGIENLNYLAEEIALQSDLEEFQSITEFKHMAILIDESIFNAIEDLTIKVQALTKQLGAKASFVLQSTNNQNLLNTLPNDVDAVIITALPRLDKQALQKLIDELIERKIPSYSVVEPDLVHRGVFMATESEDDNQRRARRTALNIQATLLGDQPGYFPVLFAPQEKLVINMKTARDIELYPRFDILSQATLINQQAVGEEPALSLQDVAFEAIRANLDLVVSRLGVLSTQQDVIINRSALFPQIVVAAVSSRRDDGSINVSSGNAAEGTTSAQLTLNQVIYSESVRSAYDIQKLQQLSIEAQHRALELDIVQQATVAFLNVLRAQTQIKINQNQLNLSLANLSLAKNRLQTGSANAADVYRWQSQISTDRQTLLQSQASVRQAGEALNNLLHRPIGVVFKTTPATLEHDEVLFNGSELEDLIDNQKNLDLFQELYIKLGQQMSPELAQQDALIAAAERQLKASKRSYYVPDLNLQGNTSRIIDENRDVGTSLEDETDWEISLNLSLPLYQGGQRKATVNKADYQLQRSKVNREQVLRQVEQNVRQFFHEINASYPSIELSKQAAQSSQENLKLVRANYSQGTVSIADLIDAQNAALAAEQNSANSVYDFLIDLMNLQRSIGAFDYFLDEPSRTQRIDLIKNYVESGAQQ